VYFDIICQNFYTASNLEVDTTDKMVIALQYNNYGSCIEITTKNDLMITIHSLICMSSYITIKSYKTAHVKAPT